MGTKVPLSIGRFLVTDSETKSLYHNQRPFDKSSDAIRGTCAYVLGGNSVMHVNNSYVHTGSPKELPEVITGMKVSLNRNSKCINDYGMPHSHGSECFYYAT
jgi:hypothetical protein